eukprot:737078_1
MAARFEPKLVSLVVTRWCYLCDALDKVLKKDNFNELRKVALEKDKIHLVSSFTRDDMQQLFRFAQDIKGVHTTFEYHSKPTIHHVLPAAHLVMVDIAVVKQGDNSTIKKLKKEMKKQMRIRWLPKIEMKRTSIWISSYQKQRGVYAWIIH